MIDLVKLHFKAGNGGNGRVSFLRQKFMPKGGPDGGVGGDGGSIYLIGRKELNTLHHFVGKKSFKAEDGEMGGKQNMFGAKGEDLIIEVPVGTIVWKVADEELNAHAQFGMQEDEETVEKNQLTQKKLQSLRLDDIEKEQMFEILEDGQKVLLARGGKGGKGNESFKSSRNTTPMECEEGTPGDELVVLFELKLLADLGLVGFPNAGKSTFLSLVTKANPRIANYPFTTIEPNLGVMSISGDNKDSREVVIADIPGLIEGASEGKGLGTQFLRHVERCRALMFVLYLEESVIFDEGLSVTQKVAHLEKQYQLLQAELEKYGDKLLKLPQFVSVSKIDLYDEELRAEIMRQLRGNSTPLKLSGVDPEDPILWSGVTREGLEDIKKRVQKLFS